MDNLIGFDVTHVTFDEFGPVPPQVWATAIFCTDNPLLAHFIAQQYGWRQLETAPGFYTTPNRNIVWVVTDPVAGDEVSAGRIFAIRGKPPFIHRSRIKLGLRHEERALSDF